MPPPVTEDPDELLDFLYHPDLSMARADIRALLGNEDAKSVLGALKFYLLGLLRGILREESLGDLLWLSVEEMLPDLLAVIEKKGLPE